MLPQIPIETRELRLAKKDDKQPFINQVTYVDMNIDGKNERVWEYVIQDLAYDMILGDPWMRSNGVVYNALALAARICNTKDNDTKIFAASIEDIPKALRVKSKQTLEDIKASLPQGIRHNAHFFMGDEKLEFSPHRPGADTKIDIIKDKREREKDIPWGPLYDMSRKELLVLRKTLTDHLGKNWIRSSSSTGGAPVLFVKKPGGGLRFCVDYRALNAVSVKDRYPLPLIKETLRQVAKATWVSKVDVCAAFHKLRIREGDESKTVFRTRYSSFECVLGGFLGDFCSAYLDDFLIYTRGDIADHWTKVNQVLQRLGIAGLQMDLKKTKGIRVDSEKIQAIKNWQAPTTTKGVRSFIGFAHFYRNFIPNFVLFAQPLLAPKKGIAFRWENLHRKAFKRLRTLFTTALVLALWDDEKDTILEADCSGYVIEGCLSQKDENGYLGPVAHFSRN
ncbi:hypothetical protein K3495_g1032 [Podosphaera aphanis]|nr:hypothetical protein K3495_g1032 [Podosphaera aphanis]